MVNERALPGNAAKYAEAMAVVEAIADTPRVPMTSVTPEMWDRAQAALRAVLPIVEAHTPPLSTAGTMVRIRDQVRNAIVGPLCTCDSAMRDSCSNAVFTESGACHCVCHEIRP